MEWLLLAILVDGVYDNWLISHEEEYFITYSVSILVYSFFVLCIFDLVNAIFYNNLSTSYAVRNIVGNFFGSFAVYFICSNLIVLYTYFIFELPMSYSLRRLFSSLVVLIAGVFVLYCLLLCF